MKLRRRKKEKNSYNISYFMILNDPGYFFYPLNYIRFFISESTFHLSHSCGNRNNAASKMARGITWLKSQIGSINPWPKETINKSTASKYIAYFLNKPIISKKPPIIST